jgi:tetratricopeptide (TPR) repeat protein/DNA-binding winged helix-turn-helix (wHTH) protein
MDRTRGDHVTIGGHPCARAGLRRLSSARLDCDSDVIFSCQLRGKSGILYINNPKPGGCNDRKAIFFRILSDFVMDVPEKTVYRFDEIEVDSSRLCVRSKGEERHLRQKAYQVLVYLLDRPEKVVSKEEIFTSVWPNTSVTDDVLVQCVKEIRRTLGDDPHKPRYIKTIPKVGYRFIAPVSRESDAGANGHLRGPGPAEPPAGHVPRPVFRWSIALILIAGGLLTVGLYFDWARVYLARERDSPTPDGRKTIAVMALENRTGDPELNWMREGLADMLIAGLSRSNGLTLIDRGRLHELETKAGREIDAIATEDANEVARRVRAEVFVIGSFARLGDRLRIDSHLHRTETGELLGSETLTVDGTEQVLSEIDLLSLKIANRLSNAEVAGDELASVTTGNLEAYRYYSLAVEKANGFQSQAAIELLQRAVDLDPNFSMAHARIGYTYAVTWGRADEGKPYLEKAFLHSSRLSERERLNIAAWYAIANRDYAAAIDAYRQIVVRFPFEIEAYWRLSRLLRGEERHAEAIAVLKQGLAVDPQADQLYNSLGSLLSLQGDHAAALAAHERYVTLAPEEPNAYDSLGLSYLWAGNYDRAVELFDRALAIDPDFNIAIIHLANARVRQGRYNAAIDLCRRFVATASGGGERSRGYGCQAYIHLRRGQLRLAEDATAKAAAESSDYADLPGFEIAMRLGQRSKAAEIERRLLAEPTYVDRGSRLNARFDHHNRGVIAMHRGRADEAVEQFRKVAAYAPPTWHFVDFEDSLGTALIALGRYDEAAAEFERILRLSPNYPLGHYHLAEACRGKGLSGPARDNYLKFLEQWKAADPDIPEVVKARKLVRSL